MLLERKFYLYPVKKVLKKLLFLSFLLLFGGLAGLYYVAFSPNVIKDKAIITIKKETDFDGLVKQLFPYLKHPATFRLTARLKKFYRPKAGKYLIVKGMNNNTLINMFRSGRQTEINVTFNNIDSPAELAGKIASYLEVDSLTLLQTMLDEEFLKKHGFTPETALLMYIPNTYRFYYTTDAETFRNRMWQEYRRFWNEERRQKARNLGLTPIEAGILASIVRKETVKKEEKPVIAGVYLNRLRKGMKLEADPTAVYAYKRVTGDTATIRRVLNKHIAVNSPYNTYKYYGLPPGPISMPEIEDIDAVLNARKHQYLYFSADPSKPGYHLFASTYAQHLKNARAYRKFLNKQGIKK